MYLLSPPHLRIIAAISLVALTPGPASAHMKSLPRSGWAAWARCIAPATPAWIATSRSRSCPSCSPRIPSALARFRARSEDARLAEPSQHRRHPRPRGGVRPSPALVLELVEGPTLADRIAQGPIPIDEALPIAKPDRRGARGRARAGHHSPRSEARQHQGPRRWHGEGAGLRPRQGAGAAGRRRQRGRCLDFPDDHVAGDDDARRHRSSAPPRT